LSQAKADEAEKQRLLRLESVQSDAAAVDMPKASELPNLYAAGRHPEHHLTSGIRVLGHI